MYFIFHTICHGWWRWRRLRHEAIHGHMANLDRNRHELFSLDPAASVVGGGTEVAISSRDTIQQQLSTVKALFVGLLLRALFKWLKRNSPPRAPLGSLKHWVIMQSIYEAVSAMPAVSAVVIVVVKCLQFFLIYYSSIWSSLFSLAVLFCFSPVFVVIF